MLADGHHFHDRTLRQDKSDARKDSWYNRAGYLVVHVGEFYLKTKKGRENLKPLLKAALLSPDPVVDLAS